MSRYSEIFDKQAPSAELHDRLLALPQVARGKRGRGRVAAIFGAAAACCALAAGLFLSGGAVFGGITNPTNGSAISIAAPVGQSLSQDGTPRLPEIQYSEAAREASADIGLPKGYFTEQLSQGNYETIFGESGWWEAIGWTMEGEAMYDGEGALWQIFLSGEDGQGGSYTLDLAPNQIPPTCIAATPEEYNDVWGTQVAATRNYYDCDGDGVKEYMYTLTFLRQETVGARLELTAESDDSAQRLIQEALARLLLPEREVSLDAFVPEEIPEWRSERLTEEACRQEPEFAAYVPSAIPERFQFEGGGVEFGQGRDYMDLCWYADLGWSAVDVDIDKLPDEAYLESCLADLSNPASYDVRLYPASNWTDSVPEEYWQIMDNPVFRAEDMTYELLKARAQERLKSESALPHLQFQLLYGDGTVARYRADLSIDEMWALLQSIQRQK